MDCRCPNSCRCFTCPSDSTSFTASCIAAILSATNFLLSTPSSFSFILFVSSSPSSFPSSFLFASSSSSSSSSSFVAASVNAIGATDEDNDDEKEDDDTDDVTLAVASAADCRRAFLGDGELHSSQLTTSSTSLQPLSEEYPVKSTLS